MAFSQTIASRFEGVHGLLFGYNHFTLNDVSSLG